MRGEDATHSGGPQVEVLQDTSRRSQVYVASSDTSNLISPSSPAAVLLYKESFQEIKEGKYDPFCSHCYVL